MLQRWLLSSRAEEDDAIDLISSDEDAPAEDLGAQSRAELSKGHLKRLI
jgi:hypothetical protein